MAAKTAPTLIIVESPAKAEKINSLFPRKVRAIATYGPISDLARVVGEVGIDRESMLGQYELIADAARRMDGVRAIAKIRKFLDEHPDAIVFLGTDPDPEGESIAAFVIKFLSLRGARRLRFNALTVEAIEQAMIIAGPIDWHAVAAREARRLIDRVIAHITAPLMGQFLSQRGSHGIGRLQAAVEALVIEKERKLRAYRKRALYSAHLDLGGWEARWVPPTASPSPAGLSNDHFDDTTQPPASEDQQAAHASTQHRALLVEYVEDFDVAVQAPSPFNLFSLIRSANRALGWEAERTLLAAQRLFDGVEAEHGHITFPRTASTMLSQGAAQAARTLLRSKGYAVTEAALPSSQRPGATEAIRPVYFDVESAGSTDDERALYRLIRERALFSQLAPAVSAVKKVGLVSASGNDRFEATSRALVAPGWLGDNVSNRPALRDDAPPFGAGQRLRLPVLAQGALVNVRHAEVRTMESTPPRRYTLRSLVAHLEAIGIGRVDTVVPLLKAALGRGMVRERPDRTLEATAVAERWYSVIYPSCGIAHIGYAVEMERALDAVAAGQLDGPALVRHVWDQLEKDWAVLGYR